MGWSCSKCTYVNENEAQPSCTACNEVRVLQCPTCKEEIKYGRRLMVQGKVYHPDCFQCVVCHKIFPDNKFQIKEDQPYHPECLQAQIRALQSKVKHDKDEVGWQCPKCTFLNPNESNANCAACNEIRVLECPGCKGEIKFGRRMTVNGKVYHPECFKCAECQRSFPNNQFLVKDGSFYHNECLQKLLRAKDGPVKSNEGWQCSRCTFINKDESLANCEACNEIRVLICPTCKDEIKFGPRLTVMGKVYHPDCFRCTACHKSFPTNQFQMKDGEPYHGECYETLFRPRCEVCCDYIPFVSGTSRMTYKEIPFWNIKYCPVHEDRNRCCSCQRVEPTARNNHFDLLADGRKICHDCVDLIVLDTHEAKSIVKDVWEFMASIGIRLPEIPVYLVELPVLNEHHEKEKCGTRSHSAKKDATWHVTRGLCLSEVSRVRHMVRHHGNPVPEVVSIDTNRAVNAILILNGLPYDLTAQVLAHEATHAYIKLSDSFPEQIPPKVEEGMCQLMSYLWLKYKQMMTNKEQGTFPYRLREYCIYQLESEQCPVYGDGFREALEAYNRTRSLQQMFDAIRYHASFP